MNRLKQLVLLTLVSMPMVAVPLHGQEEAGGGTTTGGAPCGTLFYFCGGDGYSHYTSGSPAVGAGHSNCMWCVSNNINIEAYPNCHTACSASIPMALKGRYAAVLKAASHANSVAAVIKAGVLAPGYVVFNEERRSVQIKSCSKEGVIANLRIHTSEELRMASALPRSDEGVSSQRVASTRE